MALTQIEQVDSHFCCNCLENIPSGEAKLKRNQCNKCFDCPSCQHTLSSRATTVQVPKKPEGEGGKNAAAGDTKPKKMYYLTCLACRWTSRDVGIPDQATGETNVTANSGTMLSMGSSVAAIRFENDFLQEIW